MHKKFKNKNYPHKKKDKASISMAKHNLGAGALEHSFYHIFFFDFGVSYLRSVKLNKHFKAQEVDLDEFKFCTFSC